MKTKNKLLNRIFLGVFLLTSSVMFAQTNTGPQTVCAGSLAEPYLINSPTPGSTYQWTVPPAGGIIASGQGTDYITVDWGTALGVYTISVVETDINGCPGNPSTVDVTVNSLDDATFTLTDYCEGSPNSAMVTGTSGGVFTFTTAPTGGETINSVTGEITGGIGGTTYDVTYTTTGICPQYSTETVTVNPLDDATFTLTDYCEGSANSATVTGTLGGVFSFTIPSPTGGETIDPLTGEIIGGIGGTIYSVTYTTPTGPCSQSSVQTVTVNPLPITGPINHW